MFIYSIVLIEICVSDDLGKIRHFRHPNRVRRKSGHYEIVGTKLIACADC